MAPTDKHTFEWQTSEIIKCLLVDDEEESGNRSFGDDMGLVTDGPGLFVSDDFDPVLIADNLKKVADSLNDDMTFKAALNDLKKAAAHEAAEAAFSHGVEALCQAAQRSDLAPEMQLIRASVALGCYVKKSCPELKNKLQRAMTAFLNRRVGTWVDQQGGWDIVSGVSA